MERKLYIEYRVYFDPRTNQDLLKEIADAGQERVYDLFEGRVDETTGPLPSPHDVTYEIVMEIKEEAKL